MNENRPLNERMRQELKEWGQRLDHLKVQMALGRKEAKGKRDEVVEDLRRRWESLGRELDEMKESGSSTWASANSRLEGAWKELKSGVRSAFAKSRGKDHVPVAEVMSKKPAVIREGDSLAEAARVMWTKDCGFVPVMSTDGHLAGVLTDRDVCMGALTQNRSLSDTPVSLSMTRQIAFCGPEDDLFMAQDVMRRHLVRRLPVVDDHDHLVGILSLNDVARHATRSSNELRLEVSETLAKLCEPHAQKQGPAIPLSAPPRGAESGA